MKNYAKAFLMLGLIGLGFSGFCVDLVTITDGAPVFAPEELVTPVLTAIAAFVTACVGIYVLVAGIRWIKRIFGVKA